MNAEQKQRAVELLAAWRATAYALHADRMADLLQEMLDAPEAEPVAATTLIQTAPKTIYLNISEDGDGSEPFPKGLHSDDIGWSEYPAIAETVKYIRADLVEREQPHYEPVGYLYTNLQSGEYHVSDYDDDYRGPERALWCIEPVYRRAKGQQP